VTQSGESRIAASGVDDHAFDISVERRPQDYCTQIGLAAALRVDAGAFVDSLYGSIQGTDNTIHVSSDAHLCAVQLKIMGDGNHVTIGRGVRLTRRPSLGTRRMETFGGMAPASQLANVPNCLTLESNFKAARTFYDLVSVCMLLKDANFS
jgi:hypothetical protein